MLQATEKLENFRTELNFLGKAHKPFFFLIDFEMEKPFVCKLDRIDPWKIIYDFNGITNVESECRESAGMSIKKRFPVDFETYSQAFDILQNNLHLGNTYLVNLTFPTEIELDFSLREIFWKSSARYRLMYKDEFVMFSPECFIKIYDDHIFSYPMKGTIDASVENAEEIILNDQKESWEHNTIVDLIRNDLSIAADEIEVTKFRFIDRIKTPDKDLLQVSSEIRGRLGSGWQQRVGDIILKLLPAGSISGAPKLKTVEIIHSAESGARGYYTGISGIFNGASLDSAVNIRYIERNSGKLYFRSGGGITSSSNAESEYREMLDKVNVPSNG